MPTLQTNVNVLQGGIIENVSEQLLSAQAPGACVDGINYEPDLDGGYARVLGYGKYDSTAVGGVSESGAVKGCWVFNGGVVAQRGDNVYFSGGAGWTKLNGATARTGVTKARGHKFNWTNEVLCIVDGVNKPALYEPSGGTVWQEIGSSSDVEGASCVHEFKNYLFFGVGSKVVFSAPNDATDFSGASGAGEINFGFPVVALKPWRDQLYVFGTTDLVKITGSVFGGSSPDLVVSPVTSNIGTVAPDSVQEIGGDVVYLSSDGIRTIAGTEKIGDVDLASISRQIQDRVNSIYRTYGNSSINSVVIRSKSQYRLLTYASSITANDTRGLVGGFRQGVASDQTAWEWFETRHFQAACADSDYIGDDETVIFGDPNGYIMEMEQETGGFDGENVYAYFALPDLYFGDPKVRKVIHKVDVEIEVAGNVSLEVKTLLDREDEDNIQPAPYTITTTVSGTATFDSATAIFDNSDTVFSSPPELDGRFNAEGSFKALQYVFTTEDTNPAHSIRSIVTQYTTQGND